VRHRRLIAALLASCLLLAACSGTTQTEQTVQVEQTDEVTAAPTETQPTSETTSAGMAYSVTDGWNPYDALGQENRTIAALLYEGLFEVAPDFTASPVLCADYTATDDLMTYTFKLSSDARFSDGTAVTAADVVASYEIAAESDYYAGRFAHITDYTATDDQTLTVTLDTACGTLPLLLDIPVVKRGTASEAHPTGSGAYVLKTAPLRLEPTDWWRDLPLPFGDESVSLTAAVDEMEVRDAFEMRSVSVVCTDPAAGAASVYHSDYELWTCPTTVMIYLGFNLESPLFSEETVRAQITHLIDRDSIVGTDFGSFGVAANLPASPLSDCYDRSLAVKYAYDPSEFTASVTSGTGTLLVNAGDSSRVAAANRIAAALSEVGIDLTVNALTTDAYRTALAEGNFDCYLGEIRLSADFNLESFFQTDGAASYGIGSEEGALALCARMLENEGNAYDLHKYVMDNGLLCPILFKTYAVYTARGAFQTLNAAPYNIFYQ
jgi:peptide/nickel transport system substrate-binding protein